MITVVLGSWFREDNSELTATLDAIIKQGAVPGNDLKLLLVPGDGSESVWLDGVRTLEMGSQFVCVDRGVQCHRPFKDLWASRFDLAMPYDSARHRWIPTILAGKKTQATWAFLTFWHTETKLLLSKYPEDHLMNLYGSAAGAAFDLYASKAEDSGGLSILKLPLDPWGQEIIT